jgi:hypothetical protein
MGTTLRKAINQGKKIAEQVNETVLIIHDLEYEEVYGLDLAFYPVRESRLDDVDPDMKVVMSVGD